MDSRTNTPDRKMAWYHVNKRFLPIKTCFLFCFAALGSLFPFIPLYGYQLGFSASEVGLTYGITPFIGMVVQPIFGAISDKFRRHKEMMILCIVCWVGFCELLLVVPQRTTVKLTQIHTNVECDSDSYISDCNLFDAQSLTKRDMKQCRLDLAEYINVKIPNNIESGQKVCKASCFIDNPPLHNTPSACFSNISHQQGIRCENSVLLLADQHFNFSIKDANDLTQSKDIYNVSKISDGATSADTACRKYGLKNLIYQEQTFSDLYCEEKTIFKCIMSCHPGIGNKCTEESASSFDASFWLFFVLVVLGHIGISPCISILEAVSYTLLGTRRYEWGRQRLFGTISFALCAVAATFIMDSMKRTEQGVDYSISFYVFGGLCFLACLSTWFLNIPKDFECSNYFKNVRRLLTNIEILAFLLMAFLMGAMHTANSMFLYLFLHDLGATQLVIGLNIVVETCVAETPMLFMAGKIIQKIGHLNCVYLTFVAYAVRFICYSFLTNAWYVLPVATLHGITFALFWSSCTAHVSIIAPKEIFASAQGLLGGLHWGIGRGVGSIITGLLYDSLGARWTFRVVAMYSLTLLVGYVSLNVFYFKAHRKEISTDANEGDAGSKLDAIVGEELQDMKNNRTSHLEATSVLIKDSERTDKNRSEI